MKTVIYKDFYGYKATTEQNYHAPIQDANKIQKLRGFTSPEQIINYFCMYFGNTPDDFIIMCEGAPEQKEQKKELATV